MSPAKPRGAVSGSVRKANLGKRPVSTPAVGESGPSRGPAQSRGPVTREPRDDDPDVEATYPSTLAALTVESLLSVVAKTGGGSKEMSEGGDPVAGHGGIVGVSRGVTAEEGGDQVTSQATESGKDMSPTLPRGVFEATEPEGVVERPFDPVLAPDAEKEGASREEGVAQESLAVRVPKGEKASHVPEPAAGVIEGPRMATPASVDRADAMDILHHMATIQAGDSLPSSEERAGDDDQPPTESGIGFEQVEEMKIELEGTKAELGRALGMIEALTKDMEAAKVSHSALSTAFDSLVRAIERSQNVDRKLKEKTEREQLAEGRAIEMSTAAAYESTLQEVREDAAAIPGPIKGKGPSQAPIVAKKPLILFRED